MKHCKAATVCVFKLKPHKQKQYETLIAQPAAIAGSNCKIFALVFFPLFSLKSSVHSALVLRCCPDLIYGDGFQGSYSKLHGP